MQRRRQFRRTQMKALMDLQIQRQAQEMVAPRRALRGQAPGLRVGADEDVQAVVECAVVDGDTPRAAAEGRGRFKHCDRDVARGEFHGRGHAGVAAADDGD